MNTDVTVITAARFAAILAALGFTGLIIFQIQLALGLPYGKAAWGGKYRVLPKRLRIASLFSALLLVFVSLLVLERAGIISVIKSPPVVTSGVWSFAGYLVLNTVGNLVSRSKAEKRMAAVSGILCLLCLAVAIFSG